MFIHQVGGKFRRALKRGRTAIASIFAHFDSDGIPVTWTVKVGMFTLFIGRQVLDRTVLIGGEVPDKVADAITASTFTSTEFTIFQCQGMTQRIRTAGIILGAVDGDVFRRHRASVFPSMCSARDVVFFDIHLTVKSRGTLGS